MNRREDLAEGITLYLGDCREILPTLGKVDAVVTDPPYGIGYEYASYDDSEENWYALINDILPKMKAMADFIVMPNCRMQAMGWWFKNHNPDWIIAWYKGSPGHRASIGFNDWEPHLVWGRPKDNMHDFFQTPLTIDSGGHPCAKPMAYTNWLVSRAARVGGTIVDPFMGSGTTGASCVKLGRNFYGIEIDPLYFDIACKRISDMIKQPDMFVEQPKPIKQVAML